MGSTGITDPPPIYVAGSTGIIDSTQVSIVGSTGITDPPPIYVAGSTGIIDSTQVSTAGSIKITDPALGSMDMSACNLSENYDIFSWRITSVFYTSYR